MTIYSHNIENDKYPLQDSKAFTKQLNNSTYIQSSEKINSNRSARSKHHNYSKYHNYNENQINDIARQTLSAYDDDTLSWFKKQPMSIKISFLENIICMQEETAKVIDQEKAKQRELQLEIDKLKNKKTTNAQIKKYCENIFITLNTAWLTMWLCVCWLLVDWWGSNYSDNESIPKLSIEQPSIQ